MTTKPSRIIDAHVHLWDPARTDWYPYLSGAMFAGSGDSSRMNRRFNPITYLDESAGWNVTGVINVAAATGLGSVEETLELDRRAEQGEDLPHAIVGGLPPADTIREAIELIDRQMAAPRFRGVRPMGPRAPKVPPPEVLAALRDRNLVFELMGHPDDLEDAAGALAAVDDVAVVIEHTGWPLSTVAAQRELWDRGMAALADLGDRVACKLSGLAVPMGSLAADDWAPWIERAIELFGPERCLFASNFPVDSVHGTFDELYGMFSEVTAGLDDEARDQLFAGTAERIYRL